MLKYINTFVIKCKKAMFSIDSSLKSTNNLEENKKKLRKKIKIIMAFQHDATEEIMKHLNSTEYASHRVLMREMKFLIHYTFAILKDDFYKGENILEKNITKIDDYVFSQYRNKPELQYNIKKLTTIAFSKRFDDLPKENFLSYFVFVEETGFEFIALLQDYSQLLNRLEKESTFHLFKQLLQLNGKYNTKATVNIGSKNQKKYKTLMTQNLTEIMSPTKANFKITKKVLEHDNFKK